jgi:Flp pilus assembly pilin Flp
MLSTLGELIKYLRRLRDDESGAATTDGLVAVASLAVCVAIVWYLIDQRFDLFAGRIVAGLEQALSAATTGTAPSVDGSGASG